VDRLGLAVIIDADAVAQPGRRAPRAHRRQLAPERIEGARHLRLYLFHHTLRVRRSHRRHPPDDTIEPTASPRTIRLMLPDRVRSKTMIGSLLSMQSEIAAASMTCKPRLRTSMEVIRSRRRALASCFGSAE